MALRGRPSKLALGSEALKVSDIVYASLVFLSVSIYNPFFLKLNIQGETGLMYFFVHCSSFQDELETV